MGLQRVVRKVVGMGLVACLGVASAAGAAGGASACHVGAYRLDSGEIIDLNASSEAGRLRWHRVDGRTGTLAVQPDGTWRGTTGWTDRIDPTIARLGACGEDRIEFDGQGARRIALDVTDTRFAGRYVQLRGRLVMPRGDAAVPVPVPVVVLVHGSESYSGVDFYHAQHLFPAHGIGVFVYDKRGTGQSSGKYTQDFDVLADDAVAALAEARRLGGQRIARAGYLGSSQGGWVAPLAATRGPVDFVAVAYGLAESPAAEDRGQVMQELAAAGYGPDVQRSAREVTDATAAFMADRSRANATALAAVKRKLRHAPWWPVMQGEYTGALLRYPPWLIRLASPWFDRGTPWAHDPMPVLRSVQAPQLWMIAAEDREAPPTETLARLRTLMAEGRPVDVAVFPRTDHGIVEFEEGPSGRRRVRYADGYLRMSMDFIRDRRLAPGGYGEASILPGAL